MAKPEYGEETDKMRLAEVKLDVRPLLANGQELLAVILNAASGVKPDGVLVLDAPFHPAPLRRLLSSKGFTHTLQWLADDHCRVMFHREAASAPVMTRDDLRARIWQDGNITHIDVRGLTPPNPMTAVLRLVEGGKLRVTCDHAP